MIAPASADYLEDYCKENPGDELYCKEPKAVPRQPGMYRVNTETTVSGGGSAHNDDAGGGAESWAKTYASLALAENCERATGHGWESGCGAYLGCEAWTQNDTVWFAICEGNPYEWVEE
ncbi:MAG: hypothetical protein M3Q61_05540 [Chloroflexota bacterium]|nr:hypothetical protein [Chloroflexota bacterium]